MKLHQLHQPLVTRRLEISRWGRFGGKLQNLTASYSQARPVRSTLTYENELIAFAALPNLIIGIKLAADVSPLRKIVSNVLQVWVRTIARIEHGSLNSLAFLVNRA